MKPTKPTKPPFVIVAAAWVAIVLLGVAVCQAATLPPELKAVQSNLCEIRAGSSLGSGVYMGAGIVLSCQHVVDRVKRVKVRFFGGGEYEGVVVGASKRFDNAYIRIKRPVEKAIRGIRLAPKDPKNGDAIWRAGYGHSPRKLFWHKGTMNHSYGGWIQVSGRSIGGDSGGAMFAIRDGEVVLIGNLWGTDGKNTIGSKPSTITKTLGTYALDALNTEWHLTANCGPSGCSPQRTQVGGGLFSGGLRQRVTPKAPEPRAPGGIAAEVPPLDVDTGLISAQVATMQDQANAAIQQANAATQAVQDQLASEREDRQKAVVDDLRAELAAANMPAFPDPITSSGPREDAATSRMSMSETAERYLPWIVIIIGIVAGLIAAVMYLMKDRKKDGNTSMADVGQAVALAQQTAAKVEVMLENFVAAFQSPPSVPPSPPPIPTSGPLPDPWSRAEAAAGTLPGQSNSSPLVLARATAATLKELNTQQAEAKVTAVTANTRAREDVQRDADALTEAAKDLEAVE